MDCTAQVKLYDVEVLANSYALSSPIVIVSSDQSLRQSFAKDLAASVILRSKNASTAIKLQSNNHPDLFEMAPEGKSDLYLMETIKQFLQEVHLSPFESMHKVYLFHDADKMLPIHANALLKTLEEKPSHAVILLTTENRRKLLPTILSRCQVVTLPRPETLEVDNKLKIAVLNAFFEAIANNYLTLSSHIQEIEAEMNEGFNQDLFTILLHIVKDLELLRLKSSQNLLSYPEEIERYSKAKTDISFERISHIVSTAGEALQRSMRPKTILEYIFLSLGQ